MTDRAPSATTHPLQRLVLLTGILGGAGSWGVRAIELADRLGYSGTAESRRESLARDIRRLREAGIEIVNAAAPGDEARWVLHPGDSRIRLAFTAEQLAELQRAAWLADRDAIAASLGATPGSRPANAVSVRPGSPPILDQVSRAVAARCRLRFTYNGRARALHPAALHPDAGGWTVSGWDEDRDAVRTYRVARMSEVSLDAPGSGADVSGTIPAGTSTDPLTWSIDPPVTAALSGPARYRSDVHHLLGAGVQVVSPAPGSDEATTRYETVVSNRWIFLARVMELGERVRLDEPEELRAELAERLRAAIGPAS